MSNKHKLTLETLDQWQPDISQTKLSTINTLECHTGGEPLRIITNGFPELNGKTMLAKRRDCQQNHDELRRALIFEPRGHTDMYGAIITPPERDNSHFGALFIHNEGYSTMCGHAVIALTKCAVESGLVVQTGEVTKVIIDVPCGQIHAKAYATPSRQENNSSTIITRVSFESVPSFVYASKQSVEIADIGTVNFDIAFGGAFYAYVQAKSIKLSLSKHNHQQIIDYGKKIKAAIINSMVIEHPFEADLSFLYGVIFIEEKTEKRAINDNPNIGVHSRNVCVFADGELDRSPTGSGVSGRIALHVANNEVALNQSIIIESIIASQFQVQAVKQLNYGDFPAVIAQVTGNAFVCGKAQWLINPNDPLKHGFLLR